MPGTMRAAPPATGLPRVEDCIDVLHGRPGYCRLPALSLVLGFVVFSFGSVLQSLQKSGQSPDAFSGSGAQRYKLILKLGPTVELHALCHCVDIPGTEGAYGY